VAYDLTAALRDRSVCELLRLVGVPYLWGGNDPWNGGVDCSGAILWAYKGAGIQLPDLRARDLASRCELFTEPIEAKMGDLVFYGGGNITHVVMVVAPGARAVAGANGGTSFRKLGLKADLPADLDPADAILYRMEMDERDARVKIEADGWHYRKDFRGFGRIPL